MTRTNFLLGVAVSLVLPLACLLYGLSAAQPPSAEAVSVPSRPDAASDMGRVQQRFVQILKKRAGR